MGGANSSLIYKPFFERDQTFKRNVSHNLNGYDLTFIGNNSTIDLINSTVNNDTPLLHIEKAMSNNSNRSTFIDGQEYGQITNYFRIFNKGNVNYDNNLGIGFYSNTGMTRGTEYTYQGIYNLAQEFFITVGEGHSHFQLRSGGSDVNDIGYIKMLNYNGSNTNLQIQRTGLNYFKPDSVAGQTGRVVLMGTDTLSIETISLQDDTYVGGELIMKAITAPVADSHLIDDSFAFHVDGGVLKGRYKDALSVVGDLVIGSGLVKDEGSATILEGSWNGNTNYNYSIAVAGSIKGDTFNVYLDDDVFSNIKTAGAEDNSYAYCNVDGTVEVVCRVTSFITIPVSSTIKVKNIK